MEYGVGVPLVVEDAICGNVIDRIAVPLYLQIQVGCGRIAADILTAAVVRRSPYCDLRLNQVAAAYRDSKAVGFLFSSIDSPMSASRTAVVWRAQPHPDGDSAADSVGDGDGGLLSCSAMYECSGL